MNPLLIPLITSLVTSFSAIVVAWLGRKDARQNKEALRDVKKSVRTRNGDTIGEVFEELFKRIRKMERATKTLEEGQDDLLEGFAFVAAEVGRTYRRKLQLEGQE